MRRILINFFCFSKTVRKKNEKDVIGLKVKFFGDSFNNFNFVNIYNFDKTLVNDEKLNKTS